MRYAVSGGQMKQIDRDAIERIGIPSAVLMERAALAVADEVEKQMPGGPGQILAACGTGNNGADAVAAARILHCRGYGVTVLLSGDPDRATPERRLQVDIAERLGIPVVQFDGSLPAGFRVVIDGLFGIGLGREVAGDFRLLLELLQETCRDGGAVSVAVDIPSGIHADTGAVMGVALPAAATVTFGYVKCGLLLYPGRAYAGEVTVADIGFSDVNLRKAGWQASVLERADLARLPVRSADGNKGTFGKVLVIAGSRGMSGAAYLSALAAYRTGAGLVKVLTVEENRPILQSLLPEAVVAVYDPEKLSGDDRLEGQCSWADVIVLGPGLGREPYVEYLVETVLSHAYVPIVLDADGLNTVAALPYLTRYFTENIIVTPHMAEMARLSGMSVDGLKADPLAAAREYSARNQAVCVLKDAATVIADKEGNAWVNTSGCSAMAKGGSGDVLSGVVAGLLARGMECLDAAAFGVYIHGLAGERAAEIHGTDGVLARDIADSLLR